MWWGFIEIDKLLVWEVINLDTFFGTNNEPIDLGGEKNNVDW